MAMLFCDSFDHYTTLAQMMLKWTSYDNNGGNPTIGAAGRWGTNSLTIPRGDTAVVKVLPGGTKTTLIAGTGFYITANPGATPFHIVAIMEAANSQCVVQFRSDNKLQVVIPGGTFIGTTVLNSGTYYYIELKCTVNAVTGSFTLRINNNVELTQNNVNTARGANIWADSIKVGAGYQAGAWANTSAQFDDLYVCDTLGTTNNDFLGDVRVQALFPNGASADGAGHTQWTPFAGGGNFANVNEVTPNDDTTYVSSATVGQIDTYTFSDLSAANGTVKAIQIIPYMRKDDAGVRQVAPVVRQAAVDYVGATQTLGATYSFYPVVYDQNPATAAAWTIAQVNGDEFGVKVIA